MIEEKQELFTLSTHVDRKTFDEFTLKTSVELHYSKSKVLEMLVKAFNRNPKIIEKKGEKK